VEALYHEALSKPREQRAQFLESACRGDEWLRREVSSLLDSLEKDGARLEDRALEVAARMLARGEASLPAGPQPGAPENLASPGKSGVNQLSKAGVVHPEGAAEREIRRRVPLSLWFLAAVFVADFVLRIYCCCWGPAGFDFGIRTEEGREVVTLVSPGSAADRAGIKPGDVLLALDGQTIRGPSDWKGINSNLETGRAYRFDIVRERRRQQATYWMGRIRIFEHREFALWHIDGLLLLATALFIGFSRPYDFLARMGALALATLSASLTYWASLPTGYASIWRNLPQGVGILLWIPTVCSYLVGPIILSFFVLFPRRLFRTRWPWVIIWVPALCFVPAFFHSAFLTVYRPLQVYGNLVSNETLDAGLRLYGLYCLMSLAAMTVNYFLLTHANDRRRLRVLFIGGGAAVLPGGFRLLIWNFAPLSGVWGWISSGVPSLLVVLMFALFPVCFAYSILRHRLLDIRVIIRLGIQYAMARRGLIALVPALGGILFLDMLAHGDRPLIAILGERGWVYAAVGAVALAAHMQRQRWGEAVDRHFFREHYDASRLLRDVAGEARQAGSFSRAAPGVVARIEQALHPEFAALMQRSPDETGFRTLASAPCGLAPPVLPAESRMIELLRTLGKPVEVMLGESGWLRQRLPGPEMDLVRRARIDLFVPIAMSPGHDEALLVLGTKRSEEPYTREDQELLGTIATSLALLFGQEVLATVRTTGTFEECPQCGICCDSGSGSCTFDGAALTPVPLQRRLAGRYRLERRRGRGGMGTIYEATDKALGRRVAVKVIRDELVNSTAAAQRFAREARAAGSFDHPNVVTVHDYGVEGGTRAFLVMELLEGITLREELRMHKRLGADRILGIFRSVCGAVDAAHRHQLIHRDLKPENIFLSRSSDAGGEMVKILDFGIAKFLTAAEEAPEAQSVAETGAGILVGTIGYMSPEQLLGERPGISWDLWALAVVVYETLTGALPFPVANREVWRRSVLAGDYTPLYEHLTDPPARWQEFFAGSLAVDRAMRPRSAAEFYQNLDQMLGNGVGPR
jgi:eukaryotic-like serine/threonine-protein kinase